MVGLDPLELREVYHSLINKQYKPLSVHRDEIEYTVILYQSVGWVIGYLYLISYWCFESADMPGGIARIMVDYDDWRQRKPQWFDTDEESYWFVM